MHTINYLTLNFSDQNNFKKKNRNKGDSKQNCYKSAEFIIFHGIVFFKCKKEDEFKETHFRWI